MEDAESVAEVVAKEWTVEEDMPLDVDAARDDAD